MAIRVPASAMILAALIFLQGCGDSPKPPLVVLIVFDALRADRLSQYQHDLPTSPGLDRLAQHATVFLNSYAPSSYTTSSTASIFTGQSPLRHGTRRQGAKLRDENVTITELLRERGYRTRGISFNPVIADLTGFTQGFDDFVEREKNSPFNHYPDMEQGLDRLRVWLGEDGGEATYLYFQPMNTHGPYFVPPEYQAALLGRKPRTDFKYYGPPMGSILAGNLEARSEVTPAYLQSMNERYDTAVRYATDRLGAFFAELEAADRFDEALIIVTSDHGDELYEHGGFSHGYTLYEEVIRVPLIVKLPGQKRAAQNHSRVSILDLYPTIAEVVGARFSHAIDGRSLVPLIRGRDDEPTQTPRRLHLVAEFSPRFEGRGVIDGHHKLLSIASNYEGVSDTLRLYDLHSDPKELHDLASEEPARAREIHARLMRDLRKVEESDLLPVAEVQAGLDAERLRALGYAEVE